MKTCSPFFHVCCLSCRLNGDALCSGRNSSYWETWAGHDREAFPYWTILNHGCGSDMETKAHRPLVERGLKCLALRYGRPGLCVWPQIASLYSLLCGRERGLSFHPGLSWNMTRDGLYQQNNLLKVVYSDSHRISRCPSFILSCNYVVLVQTQRVLF